MLNSESSLVFESFQALLVAPQKTHISIQINAENTFALFETWSSTLPFIPVHSAVAGPLGSRCAVGAVAF